ncbi:NAD(P)-dependent oxidoreductase [Aspergillus undulatus]|uniref:NAD(P)-dependent oxidoreductase n=1 Tax=Aspergillus undulatus TaxID=1810928 RepID=UPI003CCDC297
MARQVSVFGLGAMGKALALQYIGTGYTTTVWNRSSEKAQALLAQGARLASKVADGVEASNLIILCLLDNPSVKETLSKATSSLPGKIIVNLTNGTPSQARELSEWVTSCGADYIHGGIMAVPDMIGSTHAVILHSGSTKAFARVEADLAHLGTAKFLGTDPGSASLHDLALLSGMYGLFSGFFQATALARSHGTSATDIIDILKPWLTAMTHYLGVLAQQIDAGDYATQGSNLAMQVAGMQNLVDTFAEQGVTPALILPFRDLMRRALEGGYGSADVSAVIEFMGNESQ